MSIRFRAKGIVFWGSLLLAQLMALIALPEALHAVRPYWLALLLIYWILEAPQRMGLGVAFFLGLLMDLLTATLFGEQALRLTVMAFIVHRLRSRMRFFPMLQQVLVVLALLVNDRIVMLMIRAFSGEQINTWSFWVAPIIGAIIWPWLFLIMDLIRQNTRAHEE
jgi:rod shape-determining protein MreD